jgi:hypothetical protein
MNKEQQELLDAAHMNYVNKHSFDEIDCHSDMELNKPNETFIPYNQEGFINKCKTNPEFSETWRLKIEERELTLEERAKWLQDNKGWDLLVGNLDHDHIREVVEEEAPTKLITLEYNGIKTESYE